MGDSGPGAERGHDGVGDHAGAVGRRAGPGRASTPPRSSGSRAAPAGACRRPRRRRARRCALERVDQLQRQRLGRPPSGTPASNSRTRSPGAASASKPEVDVGGVAVGGGGLQRRVELVDDDHVGAERAQRRATRPRERAQPAELADDDAQVLQRGADAGRGARARARRDARPGAGLGAVDVEGRAVAGPHTPSASSPQLRWKSSSARGGQRAEDAVDPSAVEPEPAELRSAALATSSPRMFGATSFSGRSPSRQSLDEREPRRLVADAAARAGRAVRWKARTAASVAAQNVPARRRPAGSRRRRGDAAGRGSPRRAAGVSGRKRGIRRAPAAAGALPLAPTSRLLTRHR